VDEVVAVGLVAVEVADLEGVGAVAEDEEVGHGKIKDHLSQSWNLVLLLTPQKMISCANVPMKKFLTSTLLFIWKTKNRLEKWMKYLDQFVTSSSL